MVKITIVNETSKYEFTMINNEKVVYYIVKDGSFAGQLVKIHWKLEDGGVSLKRA